MTRRTTLLTSSTNPSSPSSDHPKVLFSSDLSDFQKLVTAITDVLQTIVRENPEKDEIEDWVAKNVETSEDNKKVLASFAETEVP